MDHCYKITEGKTEQDISESKVKHKRPSGHRNKNKRVGSK